jgi:hypothetical protein
MEHARHGLRLRVVVRVCLGRAAILKFFTEYDEAEKRKGTTVVAPPIKLSGAAGSLAAELYADASASKNFDSVVKNLTVCQA